MGKYDDLLNKFGINLSKSLDKIKDLKVGSIFYVPYEVFFVLIETVPNSQNQYILIFLDLNSSYFSTVKGNYFQIQVLKISEFEYKIIEPIDINSLNSIGSIVKQKNYSQSFLENFFKLLQQQKKNIVMLPSPNGEKEILEYNKIYDKFLSNDYVYIWGNRELKDFEKDKILLATGKFVPKSAKQNDPLQILNVLKSRLILDESTIKLLFNTMNIHEVILGKTPTNSGIVLYGPGGTGKTEIMKVFKEIFEKLGSYVALNDNGEILKTSEVKDTKYYGAYQDYFAPKFSRAIKEARIRGIPSFIPIDEGDIFVENPKDSKGHGPDVINFFKAYVGNHKEFIVCLATNVLKENLNPIATRKGRIDIVEIPYPSVEILMKLILFFIKIYKINLLNEIPESDLKKMAEFLYLRKKPGANISYFCKNYYNLSFNVVEKYEEGKTAHEIEAETNEFKNRKIPVSEFIERYYKEVLENPDEVVEENLLDNLDLEISKYESDVFFQKLLFHNISGVIDSFDDKLKFSIILKNFYLSKKSEISISTNDYSEKIHKYLKLVNLIKLLPAIFNNSQFRNKLFIIEDEAKFEYFLSVLFPKILYVNTTNEFINEVNIILASLSLNIKEEVEKYITLLVNINNRKDYNLFSNTVPELVEKINLWSSKLGLNLDKDFLNYLNSLNSLRFQMNLDLESVIVNLCKKLDDIFLK